MILTSDDPDTQLQDKGITRGIYSRFYGKLAINCFVIEGGAIAVGDEVHLVRRRACVDSAAFTEVVTTKVTTHPRNQYDQAGLMVRLSPACWMKTSVEFEPDEPNWLGAVVTNAQYSDWSTQPVSCTWEPILKAHNR